VATTLLAQDTFDNIRVLRTKYFVSLQQIQVFLSQIREVL